MHHVRVPVGEEVPEEEVAAVRREHAVRRGNHLVLRAAEDKHWACVRLQQQRGRERKVLRNHLAHKPLQRGRHARECEVHDIVKGRVQHKAPDLRIATRGEGGRVPSDRPPVQQNVRRHKAKAQRILHDGVDSRLFLGLHGDARGPPKAWPVPPEHAVADLVRDAPHGHLVERAVALARNHQFPSARGRSPVHEDRVDVAAERRAHLGSARALQRHELHAALEQRRPQHATHHRRRPRVHDAPGHNVRNPPAQQPRGRREKSDTHRRARGDGIVQRLGFKRDGICAKVVVVLCAEHGARRRRAVCVQRVEGAVVCILCTTRRTRGCGKAEDERRNQEGGRCGRQKGGETPTCTGHSRRMQHRRKICGAQVGGKATRNVRCAGDHIDAFLAVQFECVRLVLAGLRRVYVEHARATCEAQRGAHVCAVACFSDPMYSALI
eukprot:Opistho-1_new@15389